MNEKIKDLALKAGMEDYPTYGVNTLYGNKEIENFAELIVKETIKVIQATAAESVDLDRTLVENVSWTVNDIKKHFGVEE